MIESVVDLTYRGLSLGKRIRLSQVRPSTGYLELPAPMPVGASIHLATGEGASFEATVIWVHEQVAGSDRPPGMIVAPDLATEPASAWWVSLITLADDDALRARAAGARGRSRPSTLQPSAHGAEARGIDAAVSGEAPAGAAGPGDAAGERARPADDPGAARTMIMPALDPDEVAADGPEAPGLDDLRRSREAPEAPEAGDARDARAPGGAPAAREADPEPEVTVVTMAPASEPDATAAPSGEPGIPESDDAGRTIIMASLDPATLGLDPGTSGAEHDAAGGAAQDADPTTVLELGDAQRKPER